VIADTFFWLRLLPKQWKLVAYILAQCNQSVPQAYSHYPTYLTTCPTITLPNICNIAIIKSITIICVGGIHNHNHNSFIPEGSYIGSNARDATAQTHASIIVPISIPRIYIDYRNLPQNISQLHQLYDLLMTTETTQNPSERE
jgi:hypothetical protein